MLKELRRNLTLLSTVITGTILSIVCLIALQISEHQVSSRNRLAFENHLTTIAYQLQHNQVIKNSWLGQLEVDYDLLIAIEDNGSPFLFRGAWNPLTPRQELFKKAHNTGLYTHYFNLEGEATSLLNISKVFFQIQGAYGEYYRAGLAIVPSQKGSYSLILLQDMREETAHIIYTRCLFISLSLLGIILLAFFSYWFSGRAIRPIEEAQWQQKEFIAAASHELKAPLAVIQSNTSALCYSSGEDQLRFSGNIQKECSRLARLVDDLLLLATIDANTWTIAPSPVELDSLLINLLDNFLPLAHKKHQSLELLLPDDLLLPILCDEQRMTQAISVLLDNALYYVPEYGHIQITLASITTHLIIQVIDHGPGIDLAHQAHIFDRFYKVDASRKDKNHYGLGLSIAQDIIRLHHGTLSLTDTPGGGCTFTLKLPKQALKD
ncbi:MAG: sensor histidine kinase [Cellulosilyticaceae bacterium]